ncbi:MAG: hypothetical protein P4L84_05615 [Isosphaeraceae bacterium]|nr:hypothetical protein [Isosphaeraceae bacterium]
MVWEQDAEGHVVPLGQSFDELVARAGAKKVPLPEALTKVLSKTTKPVQVYWIDRVLGSDEKFLPFEKGPFDLRLAGLDRAVDRQGKE